MFFTALILTMCLAIKNQKDEARRLQASFQDSSLHIHTVDLEFEEQVNEGYSTQPSTSFVELEPSAPGQTAANQDMVFGQFITMDIITEGHRHDTEERVERVLTRSPSLSN